MNKTQTDYQIDRIRQLNRYEDILDIFIHIMMLRLPTAFLLINMTLMIWLVQTIFSSLSADTVPRSLYFFAPLLMGQPVTDIVFSDAGCKSDYQLVRLKTFPNLNYQAIKHTNLTKWRESMYVCVKKSKNPVNFNNNNCTATPPPDNNNTTNISTSPVYCSGICASSPKQCPITSIRKISTMQPIQPTEQVFYKTQDNLYKYVLSRQNKQSFIVGLAAQYSNRCANQFHYYDTYKNFSQYWNASRDCGNQGFLAVEGYHSFDFMKTGDFLFANGIWKGNIEQQSKDSTTDLGYINRIKFNQKLPQCKNTQTIAKNLSQKITTQPIQPLFSKNLLIISFIFFTVCWAWLVAFYCCQAESPVKNPFIILLAIIEFITISFIYYQNLQTLQYQQYIRNISNCVDELSLNTVFKSWTFGIANSSPLLGILFACSAFLLLELVSHFCDYFVYQVYYFRNGREKSFIFDGEDSYMSMEIDD